MTVASSALHIDLLADDLAICRLDGSAAEPSWSRGGAFSSVTRTPRELSIVCAASSVPSRLPAGAAIDTGWRALAVRGPLDLSLVGVMLHLAEPLARAGVSLLPIGTYDTDYALVRAAQLDAAIAALRAAGHHVHLPT